MSLHIDGIPKADIYFPETNAIDIILSSFANNPQLVFRTNKMLKTLSESDHDEIKSFIDQQYRGFIRAKTTRLSFNKIVLYGDFSKFYPLKNILPYLINECIYKKTEPYEFYNAISIKDFNSENPLTQDDKIIVGQLSNEEKKELDMLNKEIDISVSKINDELFTRNYFQFLDNLNQFCDTIYLQHSDRNDVVDIIKKKKDIIEQVIKEIKL